jgi:hypothetical protein
MARMSLRTDILHGIDFSVGNCEFGGSLTPVEIR